MVQSLYVNGTWRHKPIAVIASFVAETLDIAARYDFWRASRDRLSVYAKESERGRIEAALARRVPPLTAEEVACQRQAREA